MTHPVWKPVSLEFRVEERQEYEVYFVSNYDSLCGPALGNISLVLISPPDVVKAVEKIYY
jgi:hypothetical protein